MSNYRFVISLFGEKHLGMLLVNLYSIMQNAPSASVSVFWQEVGVEKKEAFKKTFPNVDFRETNFDISSTKIKRISSKTLLWDHAAGQLTDKNICFIDVDMFVLKDVGVFFDQDFDILFTDKKTELFPLNTGVMLAKGNNKKLFFQNWLAKTVEILGDEKLLKQAISTDFPFGGADQMAFYKLVGYDKEKNDFDLTLDGVNMRAVSIPCSVLNETRSTKITDDKHILHYKGGWQMVLLEGKGFTKSRPKESSWQMYILYLKTFFEALKLLNEKSGKDYQAESLGIQIPFYLDRITLKENKLLYKLFSMMAFFDYMIGSFNMRFNKLFK